VCVCVCVCVCVHARANKGRIANARERVVEERAWEQQTTPYGSGS
jgi:hypothetical protein